MLFKKRDDPSRAFDMPRHAQVQRLDALEDLERRHRRHAGAEVAQPLAPRPQQERARARLLLEVHVVESGYGALSVANLPEASQSKRPASTSTPAMATPWPPRNLVAE